MSLPRTLKSSYIFSKTIGIERCVSGNWLVVKVKLWVTWKKKKKKWTQEECVCEWRQTVGGFRRKARNNPQFYNLHKAFIFARFERSGRASDCTIQIWDFHLTLVWHVRQYLEQFSVTVESKEKSIGIKLKHCLLTHVSSDGGWGRVCILAHIKWSLIKPLLMPEKGNAYTQT